MYIESIEQKAREGKAFYVGTNKMTLTALAGHAKVTIQNPAGSGKNIYLYSFVVINDLPVYVWGNVLENPTTNLPTPTLNIFNQNRGMTNQSVAVVKVDTGGAAMSGGTALPPIEVPPGRTVDSSFFIRVPEGKTIGISLPFLAIANPSLKIFFWEE